jgi:hypothetical protein
MAKLDPKFLQDREAAYNDEVDAKFERLKSVNFGFPEEKPAPTTVGQRAKKPYEEILADPAASRMERFVAGVVKGARGSPNVFRPLTDTPTDNPITRLGEVAALPFTMGFNALSQGFVEAGLISQRHAEEIGQAIVASTPALVSPAGMAALRGVRERMALKSSVLDDTGVPKKEIPGAAPGPAMETATRNIQLESQLSRLVAGNEKPTLQHAQQARTLIEQNPGMSEADLIRKTLGGMTEAEAQIGKTPWGQVMAKLSDDALAEVRAKAEAGAATLSIETEAGKIEGPRGDVLKGIQWQEQTRGIKPGVRAADVVTQREVEPSGEEPGGQSTAQLSPNAPEWMGRAWTGEPREVPTTEKPFSIVEPSEAPPATPAGTPAAPGATIPPKEAPEYLPGFKYPPGGQGGTVGKVLAQFKADTTAEALRDVQKRGVVGDEPAHAKATSLIQSGRWDLERVAGLNPGDTVNVEEAIAARSIADAAMLNAGRISKLALLGQYDEGAAASIMVQARMAAHNTSALFSEAGRVVRIAGQEGQVAGAQAIIGTMPLDPSGGGMTDAMYQLPGSERARLLTEKLSRDAGGPRRLLEQYAMQDSKVARDRLGSWQMRFGRATMELAYNSYLSPRTWFKIIRSGTLVTPTVSLIETAAAEFPRRALAAIAPNLVDPLGGVVKGTAWANFMSLKNALGDAVRGVGDSWRATAKVAKESGWVKGEQEFLTNLAQSNPAWGRYMQKWNFRPRISSEGFPEAPEMFGDAVAKTVDVLGAIGRHNTDGTAASHAFTFTFNYRIGAEMKTHEMAVKAGHAPGTAAYESFKNHLMETMPSEVDQAAMQHAATNTFINQGHSAVIKGLQHTMGGQHVLVRLAVAPFTRVPLNKLEYVLERTPGIQFLMDGWRNDFMAGGAKRDMSIAKVGTGLVGLMVMADLAANRYVTGSPPKDPKERQAMDDAGIPWRSYWNPVTQKWNSAGEAEPLGDWITISADMVHISRDIKDARFYDYAIPLAIAAGESFFNQGMMMGLSNWMHVFSGGDPNQTINAFTQAMRPPMPFQGDLQTLDPYLDGIRKEARGFTDHYLAMLPGNGLPSHRNRITGEPLHYEGAWPTDMLSAFATHTMSDDRVLLEITRLRGAGIEKLPDHIGGPRPPEYVETEVPGHPPGVGLTPQQKDRWIVLQTQEVKASGKTMHQTMTDLVNGERYQRMPDPEKARELAHIFMVYRGIADEKLKAEDRGLALDVRNQLMGKRIEYLPTAQQPAARERLLSTLGR